ncbi:granulysin [Rhinolophus ferrumequinum]|uniref:Granulysin n=1 Tax=Rhinolophus ferrumequinum TaxID=59479 RepID=A0A671ER25_RHIFE|nr:granulysin [Rhinolophus ferrumequinum]KAF6321163.1 granulysin [Rhinolophus ferrumequinum]
MTSGALLLLASVLLGTPGLAFSSLTPESYDLATADLYSREQSSQGLTQEEPQGDLLITKKRIHCKACQKIIQKLEEMVGKSPNKDDISQAASRVCNKMWFLRGLCKKIMKTVFRRVSQDIMAGKTPHEICVDIMMCKPQAGFV